MTIREKGPTATPEDSRPNQMEAGLANTLKPTIQQMLVDGTNEISLYGGVRKKVPIPNTEVIKLGLELQESGVQKIVNLNITLRRLETKKEFMRQKGKRVKLGPRQVLDKYRISFVFDPETSTLEYDKAFYYEDLIMVQPSSKAKRKGSIRFLEAYWQEASATVGPEGKILHIAMGALANLPDH